MRGIVVVAPDSFKGTFRAEEVAQAMGIGAVRAGWKPRLCPLADGGEGTLDAIAQARRMATHDVTVTGPLGTDISARFLLDENGLAVIESAQAVGLSLVTNLNPDTAIRASSRGLGELIGHALEAGAQSLLVTVGGTACTDGGQGLLDAIDGRRLAALDITVLCDTNTKYVDAARVFGPQKGADEIAVRELGHRLNSFAATLPRDPRDVTATGCGGGVSGALWAYGARLQSGADVLLDLVEFDRQLVGADLVISGEGQLDAQTLSGKLIARVAVRARASQCPLAIIAGRIAIGADVAERLSIVSMTAAGALEAISDAAEEICRQQVRD